MVLMNYFMFLEGFSVSVRGLVLVGCFVFGEALHLLGGDAGCELVVVMMSVDRVTSGGTVFLRLQ